MKRFFLLFFWANAPLLLDAQQPIPLRNPSFELLREWGDFEKLTGWSSCEQGSNTPPDIQPGLFGVNLSPSHGQHYITMVARPNLTWEGVSQALPVGLDSGVCYQISMDLAMDPNFHAPYEYGKLADFISPVVLQLWGGLTACEPRAYFTETPPIDHTEWRRYHVIFRHKNPQPLTTLYLMCYYVAGRRCAGYAGHVCLDNLSDIRPIPCPTHLLLNDTFQTPVETASVLENEQQLEERINELLSGISYTGNSAIFDRSCTELPGAPLPLMKNPDVDELVALLRSNPAIRIEIGFSTGSRSLRDNRRKVLHNLFIARRISSDQFDVRASFKAFETQDWKLKGQYFYANWKWAPPK